MTRREDLLQRQALLAVTGQEGPPRPPLGPLSLAAIPSGPRYRQPDSTRHWHDAVCPVRFTRKGTPGACCLSSCCGARDGQG